MRRSLIACACVVLSGCALVDGKSRSLDVSDGDGVSLDITRRAILAARHPLVDSNGNTSGEAVRVCAEPSPDGMTTVAASLAGNASTPESVNAEIAATLNESGAFVGLRTQSIQLLRDAMYRSCEAYLSGGIDSEQYALLLRRHQRYMLALLSIESLTGTVRAATVTISTESLATAARSIQDLRETAAGIDEEVDALGKEKTELVGKRDADGVSETEKTSLQEQIDKTDTRVAALESDKEVLDEAIKNASGLLASGSTKVEVSNVGIGSQRSEAHIEKVADVVGSITEQLIDTDDLGATCSVYLRTYNAERLKAAAGEARNNVQPDEVFALICQERLALVALGETTRFEAVRALTQSFEAEEIDYDQYLSALAMLQGDFPGAGVGLISPRQ